jgi:hypothetical protein
VSGSFEKEGVRDLMLVSISSSHNQNLRQDDMDQQSKRSRLSSDTSSDLGKVTKSEKNQKKLTSL